MTVRIPIHRGRADRSPVVVAYALVDDADAAWAQRSHWTLNADGYAVRRPPRIAGVRAAAVLMHRELLGITTRPEVSDHINRNKLDNRRRNLRSVSRAANNQNRDAYRNGTSCFRGVCWSKYKRRWRASAQVAGKWHHLGYFDDETQAARIAAEFRATHMPYSTEQAAA